VAAPEPDTRLPVEDGPAVLASNRDRREDHERQHDDKGQQAKGDIECALDELDTPAHAKPAGENEPAGLERRKIDTPALALIEIDVVDRPDARELAFEQLLNRQATAILCGYHDFGHVQFPRDPQQVLGFQALPELQLAIGALYRLLAQRD